MKINWISGALVIVCFFDLSDCFKFFDENNVDDNFFNSKDDCMKSPVILSKYPIMEFLQLSECQLAHRHYSPWFRWVAY